jgi:hypothetical protein
LIFNVAALVARWSVPIVMAGFLVLLYGGSH